jgi:hypothetical protein
MRRDSHDLNSAVKLAENDRERETAQHQPTK